MLKCLAMRLETFRRYSESVSLFLSCAGNSRCSQNYSDSGMPSACGNRSSFTNTGIRSTSIPNHPRDPSIEMALVALFSLPFESGFARVSHQPLTKDDILPSQCAMFLFQVIGDRIRHAFRISPDFPLVLKDELNLKQKES